MITIVNSLAAELFDCRDIVISGIMIAAKVGKVVQSNIIHLLMKARIHRVIVVQ